MKGDSKTMWKLVLEDGAVIRDVYKRQVNGYTASMLMRTVAPNHVEAYAKLSKMRDALTAGEQRS